MVPLYVSWMCVISMNKEILFMLREIEERLYEHDLRSRVYGMTIWSHVFSTSRVVSSKQR